jgi:hypothetical protein
MQRRESNSMSDDPRAGRGGSPRGRRLQILTAGDDAEDEDEDIGDAEAIDDCDR